MRERSRYPRELIWSLVLCLVLAGCGSTRSSADNPTSAGGLTPSIRDPEAGLVAVAPGFDIRTYKVVAVEKFAVTDPAVLDEGDRRFGIKMTDFLHRELLRRLRESGLFQQVVGAGEGELKPGDGPGLRLRGAITRLGRGSQAARAFGGLYGSGATRAQADMQLVDAASDRVVIVTADRRLSSYNPWTFGGSDDGNLEESFNDMARDLARFLLRLSQGQMPSSAR